MTAERPMRGAGPSVLISFSAQEQDQANRLAGTLGARGCRVTLESERAEPLSEAARGLKDIEVFVQLRTAHPDATSWLDARFEDAVRRRARYQDLVLVPIALDGPPSAGPFTEWVYVDASSQGLTELVLDLVARRASSAVHPLPLSTTSPLEFDPQTVRRILDRVPSDKKRIVTDPDDIIVGSARRIVEGLRSANFQNGEAALRQQEQFLRSVEDQMFAFDATLRKLIEKLYEQHRGYSAHDLAYGERASRSVDRFSRLALWRAVTRISKWPAYLDKQRRGQICTTATEAQKSIAAAYVGDEMHGLATWALGPRLVDGCAEFVEVEATAPGRATMRWYLPRTLLGKHWRETLMFGTRPSAEIMQGDWLDFVLPQIALRAYLATKDAQPYGPAQLESEFAWTLEGYSHMGCP